MRRLTRTIALRLTVTIAIVAIAAGFGAGILFHVAPKIATLFGAALWLIGVITMSIVMRAPLRRIRRNLGALVDGVRGFADDDFSLRLSMIRSALLPSSCAGRDADR